MLIAYIMMVPERSKGQGIKNLFVSNMMRNFWESISKDYEYTIWVFIVFGIMFDTFFK